MDIPKPVHQDKRKSQLKRNTKRLMDDGIYASRVLLFSYCNAMMVSSIVVHILEKSSLLLLDQLLERYQRVAVGTRCCSDSVI